MLVDQFELLSALSLRAGWLWQLESDSTQPMDDRPVAAVARSVLECGWPERARVSLSTPLKPARFHWLDLAADPFGRWVAVNDYQAGHLAATWAWAASTGQLLLGDVRRGNDVKVWRALAPSPDGSALWGVEGWAPSGSIDEHMPGSFVSTGALASRALTGMLPPSGRATAPLRRGAGCVLASEGERDPVVRDVQDHSRPPQRIFELALAASDAPADEARRARCVAENGADGRGPPRWGVNARGELWLDEGARLRHIDPLTAATLAERATPRSEQVCSAAIIAAGQWLSWQGDTVTLRAMTAAQGAAGRHVVVRRPGWVAEAAVWMNEGRIAVRWMNPRAEPGAPGGAEGQLYVDAGGGRFFPDGRPVPGQRLRDGRAWIDGEGDEGSLGFWPDGDAARVAWWARTASPQSPRYKWRVGPFGSVQARDATTAELRLWDGMRPGAAGDASAVRSLGGNLGLARVGGQVVVFDAAQRARRLTLRDDGPVGVAHVPQPGVLLLESDNRLTAQRLPPLRLPPTPAAAPSPHAARAPWRR